MKPGSADGGGSCTVGDAAALAGVSVRTLHHYHRIGLVVPSGRSAAGYRLYTLADLKRLQQVMYYRALGFGLAGIARLLADPAEDAGDHLRRQHRLLRQQIHDRRQMLAAIEKELEARQMGIALTPQEQFEIFGTSKHSEEWAGEAQQRWSGTGPYQESQRRSAAYTKEDWVAIRDEAAAIGRDFAAAMAAGEPAAGARAMDVAERHRQHISQWFYDCGPEMHRGLAEMYVTDQRFTKTYEDIAPGLARYVHDAVTANATRASA